jgi:hypothetical protein
MNMGNAACCLIGCFGACAIFTTQQRPPAGASRAQSVRVRELILEDDDGKTCALLSTHSGEATLQFFDSAGGRCTMELGLGLFGACFLKMRDTWSPDPEKCSQIVLENGGDPGEPTLRLVGAWNEGVPRGDLEAAVLRGGTPTLEARNRAGAHKEALGLK